MGEYVDDIASLFRRTRTHYRMSIRELADRAEVSPTTVQKIERGGDCNIRMLRKVGLQLGIFIYARNSVQDSGESE